MRCLIAIVAPFEEACDKVRQENQENKQTQVILAVLHAFVMRGSGVQIPPAAPAKSNLPACYPFRDTVAAGGLVSLSPDFDEVTRRGADYVSKIVKGAKPSELPVEQPTRYALHINLKTAKALELEVPPTVLARADEVIE